MHFVKNNLEPDSEFPIWALLPKRETGVSSFLNKYPEYDGRGIIIAIFDSGVDPGAAGLQVTSDGKTKVIGRYDCSGAGDVDTSTVICPSNGEIVGLTGRKLKIPTSWTNPSGEYHIGIKHGYDLYPKILRERTEKERKEKSWDPSFKTALADANRQLQEINQSIENLKSQTIPRDLKLKKEDFESQVEMLNLMDKKYGDLGPVYDCLVFHDGTMWRCCIDTTENGDLNKCNLVGEYDKCHEFSSLAPNDMLNYSINVHEDGNLLEIVSVSSPHGTHVASIAAACFPDQPEKNGIAPGAQIISLSIGDIRLDTMETGTALVRSMIKVMESQTTDTPISVINMSYGEHSHWASSGRIGELMSEVIDKYGVVWVCAAGNHGPALCTIGTPPDICTDNMIGVGAYVSPEMMVAEYSLRNKIPGTPYTWSSRGPTMDGAKGVCVCAPGGAITSVPQYTLRSSQLLNGTSMASPHVAGAVAVLLSGLKAKKLPWSPYTVRRALENTAQFLPNADRFAQGHGLLQVEKAFDHLAQYSTSPDLKIRFQVTCGASRSKGIHLRSGPQRKPKEVAIHIEPVFADSDNMASSEKLAFQMSLALVCDDTWVQAPAHVEMMNISRTIQVKVDPSALPFGVHSSSIRAFDVSRPEKGPVFRVEVTVVQPKVFNEETTGPGPQINATNVLVKPGQILRHFILVPEQTSYAIVKLQVLDDDKSGNFIVHCIQIRPKSACRTMEFHKMMPYSPHHELSASFKVKGGLVLEFVLAKTWTEQWDSIINYSLQLMGCPVEGETLTMTHADGIMAVDVLGGIQVEEISPVVQLKQNVLVVRPCEAKISPLGCRDIIPPSRHIYQLVLTYNFHIHKATDVTPNSSLLSKLLYESEYEAQLWILFNAQKMIVGYGDAYPSKYSLKLEKGDYVLKQQVRHEKKELLERLTDIPLLVIQKLSSAISLDVYNGYPQALIGGKRLAHATVPAGHFRIPLYIAPLAHEKLLKNTSVGQYLLGSLSLAKNELGKKVDTYNFKYILGDISKKSSCNSNNKSEKTKMEEYQEALRDFKINWLPKIGENVGDAEKLYQEMQTEFVDHVGVHSSMLGALEPDLKRPYPGQFLEPEQQRERLETAQKVYKIAGLVCEKIDETEVLAYIGMKSDQRPNASVIKTEMDKKKTALIEALIRRGASACVLFLNQETGGNMEQGGVGITMEYIDELWMSLSRFVDPNDAKATNYFGLWHAMVHEHYGRLLKTAAKLSEEKPSRELEECIIYYLKKLTWEFAANHIARSTLIRFPSNYRLF